MRATLLQCLQVSVACLSASLERWLLLKLGKLLSTKLPLELLHSQAFLQLLQSLLLLPLLFLLEYQDLLLVLMLLEPGRLRPRQQSRNWRMMRQARGRGHLLLVGLMKTELLFLLDKLLLLELQKAETFLVSKLLLLLLLLLQQLLFLGQSQLPFSLPEF